MDQLFEELPFFYTTCPPVRLAFGSFLCVFPRSFVHILLHDHFRKRMESRWGGTERSYNYVSHHSHCLLQWMVLPFMDLHQSLVIHRTASEHPSLTLLPKMKSVSLHLLTYIAIITFMQTQNLHHNQKSKSIDFWKYNLWYYVVNLVNWGRKKSISIQLRTESSLFSFLSFFLRGSSIHSMCTFPRYPKIYLFNPYVTN